LYFEVTGVVADVFVEEGDVVEAGDPIAQLVLDDYELALSKANAELQSVQSRLDLLQAGTRKEDLDAARSDYARTQARATYWRGELNRNRLLLQKNVITDSQLDQIQSEHDAAVQEEAVAKALMEKSVAGPRVEEIKTAISDVESLTQAVAQAERQRAKATLRSPFEGRIEQRLLDEGTYINVFPTGGSPVVRLVDLSQVDAVIAVPEVHLSQFEGRQQVSVVSAVDPHIEARGQIVSLGQVADLASGTYELRARISNPDGRFTAGMVVTAAAVDGPSREALHAPLVSICHAYGQPPYVLLVDETERRAVACEVQLGPLAGEQIEIRGELSEGQLLIVRGHDRVVAGDRVTYRQVAPKTRVHNE
jgi:HlyD family secretion protein